MPASDHFRAFARRPTSLPARIQSDAFGWDLAAELVDLGLGGAGVIVAEPLALGSSIRLRVDAAQLWEPLSLPARVAWMHPTTEGHVRLGLCFEPKTAASMAVLVELVGPAGFI